MLWLWLLGLALASCGDSVAQRPPSESVQGVTISTHRSGQDWGTDNIVPTMEQIRDVGAEWVAIHPYAGIRRDGKVRSRIDPDNPPEYVTRPIREAHALGLKIMVKPHIAYWGSGWSWRGEIEFEEKAHWDRFWADYRAWILTLAEVCSDADGFVVGTELDRTLGHEDQWRQLIAEVRERTDAPLTYAANWTDFERVGFWDALDVIGIQAYFPLVSEPGPSKAQLERAWSQRMSKLRTYADAQRRNVLFTEIGYNRAHQAPIRPWESKSDGPDAEAIQLLCMAVALEAIENEAAVCGAFLWKWFTYPNEYGGNFRVDTPQMKAVVRDVWSGD